MVATLSCACRPNMITHFDSAQRQAAQQDRDLFIYYESWQSPECGEIKSLIESPRMQRELAGKVVCDLDEIWEPNRRFVAQYGVQRYPAVILVHRDGTYHCHIGGVNEEQLISFLEHAKPPGRSPNIDLHIPRKIDYLWEGDLANALREAEEQRRGLFVFYKSVISADCNEMLFNVFNRPDVSVHFDDTINCMLDWAYPPNREYVAQLGIANVPGIILIRSDGTYHAQEGRMTVGQLLSFIRRAKATAGQPVGDLQMESSS
jgi:hypothetical protein